MNQKEKIKNLIEAARVGMFITQDEGQLFSRPIAVTEVDENHNIWFFTDINSEKVEDLTANKQINFSFANTDENAYVSVSGVASLVKDQDKIDEKWNVMLKAWFPEGKTSEALVLVKVTPKSAQYWDSSSSKVVMMYDLAKAILTGKAYEEVANGEHATIHY